TGAVVIGFGLACGGGPAVPWGEVVLPAGGSVVRDESDVRVVEHPAVATTEASVALRAEYDAALVAAGCQERAYPGGWRKGLLGHFVCGGARFEVVIEGKGPATATFTRASVPAP